jgi:Ca2+-binding RTX toxin-like protein
MAVTPTMQDEVAFISSVNSNGTLASKSFYGWNQNTPATYSSQWTSARKWGGTAAGSSGGTVAYYFDPASKWTATEQKWLAAGLALWSAVANIKFVQTTSSASAKITFRRTNDSGSYTYALYNPAFNACVAGGRILGTVTRGSVNIDTTDTTFGPISGLASQGGFTIENLLHEEGHALGLGHAGPYNGAVNTATQQFSAYDNKAYSLMSYINPGTSAKYSSQTPLTGVNWAGHQPTTWMPLDILAIQRLYGVAATTPLDGGEVFGFHTNISGALKPFFDFTQNATPVITIWDKGANNTLDLSGFSGKATVNLNPGTYSSAAGLSNNIAIAYNTRIDKLVCSAGGTSITCNNNGNTVIGGAGADSVHGGTGNDSLRGNGGNDTFYLSNGTDTLDGGAGTDTLVLSGKSSAYKISKSGSIILITATGIRDTLTAIEVLKFADKSLNTSATLSNFASTLGVTEKIGWDPLVTPPASNTLQTAYPTDLLATANVPLAATGPLWSNGLIESHTSWHAAAG